MTREPRGRRPRPFSVRFPILIVAMLLAGFAPYPQAAVASCAGPSLVLDEAPVWQRGSTVTVEGRSFIDGGCRDSGSCTEVLGCSKCEYDDPPPTARQDVQLELVQGTSVYQLGEADAGTADDGELGQVTWTFEVPAGMDAGRARLVVDGSDLARVRID